MPTCIDPKLPPPAKTKAVFPWPERVPSVPPRNAAKSLMAATVRTHGGFVNQQTVHDDDVAASKTAGATLVQKPSFGRPDDVRRRRVQDDAFKGIACVVPRRPLQRTGRIRIARLPAQANPLALFFELRWPPPDHLWIGPAADRTPVGRPPRAALLAHAAWPRHPRVHRP